MSSLSFVPSHVGWFSFHVGERRDAQKVKCALWPYMGTMERESSDNSGSLREDDGADGVRHCGCDLSSLWL